MTFSFDPIAFERDNRALMEAIAVPFILRHRTVIDAVNDRSSGPENPTVAGVLPLRGAVQPDETVLAVILEARREAERWFPEAAVRGNYWTRTQVNHLLTIDLPNWCSLRGMARPENGAEQLWLLLTALAATDLLHFDSDTLDELREPLRCYGQLDDEGRPGTEQSISSCRCYWPTRKQLDLGLETNPPPMPDSFDWYRDERERFSNEPAA